MVGRSQRALTSRNMALFAAGLGISIGMIAPAFAEGDPPVQTLPSGGLLLDPIMVTARRSSETLTNVPVSVGIVQKQDIEMQSPLDAAVDISRQVPNYSVTVPGNPLFAFGAIRGVGTLSFPQNPFDSTIGYALNGTPISMYAGSQQLLDVSRVEVLRGPQNVLFGRSSEGGTVNIVTAAPDGVRDIRARAEFGSNANYLTEFIAGGAIVPEVLDGRIAARMTGGNGNVTNLIGGQNLPDIDIGAVRGSLRWHAGDRTTVTATGFYENDQRDTFNYILRGGPNYPAVMLDQPLKFSRSLGIGTLEVKHEFDDFDLTGTFGFQTISSRMRSDNTDGLIYGKLTGFNPSVFSSAICSDCTSYTFEERAYSGEIRANSKPQDPVRWIAGLSLYNSRFVQGGTNTSSFGPTQNGYYNADLQLQSYSVFGEVGVPLDSRWTVTAGLRVGYDTVSRSGYYVSNGAPGTVPSFNEFGQVGDVYVAGGLSISYKIDEESLVYASVRRGYSNAGFPYFNIFAVFGKAAPSYPASYAWTYEIGARTTLLDGRLSLDGSIFYNDVRNGHVNSFDLLANTFTIAALDYRTSGFEASAKARVSEELTAYANVGFVNTAFVNVPANDTTGARNGNRLPGIPTWSGAVGLQYRTSLARLGLGGELTASGEFQFVSGDRAADIANTFDLAPYRIVNATIGWEREGIRIYGFARNLFDNAVELAGTAYSANVYAVTPGLGRVLGLGAEIKF